MPVHGQKGTWSAKGDRTGKRAEKLVAMHVHRGAWAAEINGQSAFQHSGLAYVYQCWQRRRAAPCQMLGLPLQLPLPLCWLLLLCIPLREGEVAGGERMANMTVEACEPFGPRRTGPTASAGISQTHLVRSLVVQASFVAKLAWRKASSGKERFVCQRFSPQPVLLCLGWDRESEWPTSLTMIIFSRVVLCYSTYFLDLYTACLGLKATPAFGVQSASYMCVDKYGTGHWHLGKNYCRFAISNHLINFDRGTGRGLCLTSLQASLCFYFSCY